MVRSRMLVESEELRPLEMNIDVGGSSEDGIHGFTLPQPIMDRMPIGVSTLKERLEISAGVDVTGQSTPATLPRKMQQAGQMPFRKAKVTFATTPLKGKEEIRSLQNESTPRSGGQQRSIFEDNMFGTTGAWKRTPAKDADKHSALVEVRAWLCFCVTEKARRPDQLW